MTSFGDSILAAFETYMGLGVQIGDEFTDLSAWCDACDEISIEVQSITTSFGAAITENAGTFMLAYGAKKTYPLSSLISAKDMQDAIANARAKASPTYTVTRSATKVNNGYTYTITMGPNDLDMIVCNKTNMKGTSPDCVVAEQTKGAKSWKKDVCPQIKAGGEMLSNMTGKFETTISDMRRDYTQKYEHLRIPQPRVCEFLKSISAVDP